MSNTLEIISWNLRDGINDPLIQDEIINCEPDIAVFPEAHAEGSVLEQATKRAFADAGYAMYDRPYDDDDNRKDRHALVVVAKPELVQSVTKVHLAGRNALKLTLVGEESTQLLGMHLDDRTEARRGRMAAAAIAGLGPNAIGVGDFNAMYRGAHLAGLLRTVRPLTHLLPSRDPVPGEKTPKLHRLGSLSQRTTGMASGQTMQVFTEAGFHDASETHEPTMKKGPLAIELDHIIYRGKVQVVRPTQVTSGQNLSDHRKLSARLRVH